MRPPIKASEGMTVITTQTITKATQEARIVDEKVTTTVGTATIVGVEEGILSERRMMDQFNQVRVSDQQRIIGQETLVGPQRIVGEDWIYEFTTLSEHELEKEMKIIHRHLGTQLGLSNVPLTGPQITVQSSQFTGYQSNYQSGLKNI